MATEVQEVKTQMPAAPEKKDLPNALDTSNGGGHKAHEKVEMHRAAAQVYAAAQLAQANPRNIQRCKEELEELCKDVWFAARALYKVPRGTSIAEGLNVHAAFEIAQIWGNLDISYTSHGRYGEEYQFAASCWDMQRNNRVSSPFTVEAVRYYSEGKNLKSRPMNQTEIKDSCKAAAATEQRNCILRNIPFHVKDKIIATIKNTLHEDCRDVQGTWKTIKDKFGKLGIVPHSLLRYVNCEKIEKLDAAHVADLRMLWNGAKEEPWILNEIFPERDKAVKLPEKPEETAPDATPKGSKGAKGKPATAPPKNPEPPATSDPVKSEPSPSADQSAQETAGSAENPGPATSNAPATTNAEVETAKEQTSQEPADATSEQAQEDEQEPPADDNTFDQLFG